MLDLGSVSSRIRSLTFSAIRMSPALSDLSLFLNLLLLVLLVQSWWKHGRRLLNQLWVTWQQRRPRCWKPQSPQECVHCQASLSLQVVGSKTDIRPYWQQKSRCGRKKTVVTHGFACPNPAVTCDNLFTSRIRTPMYSLKTTPRELE